MTQDAGAETGPAHAAPPPEPEPNKRRPANNPELKTAAQEWDRRYAFTHASDDDGQNTFPMSRPHHGSFEGIQANRDDWSSELFVKGKQDRYPNGRVLTTPEQFHREIGHRSRIAWWNTNQVRCNLPRGNV